MNQKERMLAGLPYRLFVDTLKEERLNVRKKVYEYNLIRPEEIQKMDILIKDILGKTGDNIFIEPPFHCDYGYNIEVGNNFYANFNLIILDVNKVIIGKNVMFGPKVLISTAGHPLHHESRNSGYEYGISVSIVDNVWFGGNVVIYPGVNIGNNVIAFGNPCKFFREITDEDRKYYYKDRIFDVTDY